jgi:hypothetical protein
MKKLTRSQLRKIILNEIISIKESPEPQVSDTSQRSKEAPSRTKPRQSSRSRSRARSRSQKQQPPEDLYREEMIAYVFSENTDKRFWDRELNGDYAGSILRQVGINAIKDLGKFVKKNKAWRKWYEKLADDGTGGTP